MKEILLSLLFVAPAIAAITPSPSPQPPTDNSPGEVERYRRESAAYVRTNLKKIYPEYTPPPAPVPVSVRPSPSPSPN